MVPKRKPPTVTSRTPHQQDLKQNRGKLASLNDLSISYPSGLNQPWLTWTTVLIKYLESFQSKWTTVILLGHIWLGLSIDEYLAIGQKLEARIWGRCTRLAANTRCDVTHQLQWWHSTKELYIPHVVFLYYSGNTENEATMLTLQISSHCSCIQISDWLFVNVF